MHNAFLVWGPIRENTTACIPMVIFRAVVLLGMWTGNFNTRRLDCLFVDRKKRRKERGVAMIKPRRIIKEDMIHSNDGDIQVVTYAWEVDGNPYGRIDIVIASENRRIPDDEITGLWDIDGALNLHRQIVEGIVAKIAKRKQTKKNQQEFDF